jgi:hypothetical protein
MLKNNNTKNVITMLKDTESKSTLDNKNMIKKCGPKNWQWVLGDP